MRMATLGDRLNAIKDLGDFLENSHQTLDHLYQQFGWNEQEFKLSSDGIPKCNKNEFSEELLLPDPLPPCLVNSKTRLIIDHDQQEKILQSLNNERTIDSSAEVRHPPKASGELLANFSREERLAIHNHVLASTAAIQPPPEITIPDEIEANKNQSTTGLSHIEIMKLERDMKRRRQAYRTKVSTKNKTQTEVTREIIANMMELLEPKKEGKQLPCMNDKKERDSNENRRDRNGTKRYDERKDHEANKYKQKYETNKHKHRKSNYRRSRSRERETSRDRRYKPEHTLHNRDRKKYGQSSSSEKYNEEKLSLKEDESKNRENSEYDSKYRIDENFVVNKEINPGKFQTDNVINVKKEKHLELLTEERLSIDSENENERYAELKANFVSQIENVLSDSMKNESRNTERYLSDGEILSSENDSDSDKYSKKKKKKKKKKHKEHKSHHKRKND